MNWMSLRYKRLKVNELMILSEQRKLEHETLIRIAGTATKNSSEEVKIISRVAAAALDGKIMER